MKKQKIVAIDGSKNLTDSDDESVSNCEKMSAFNKEQ